MAFVAVVLVAFLGIGTARGADQGDPTGTWKWSVMFNNQTREGTLKLKLEGDTIKGKIESERNGQAQSRDWEAKRSKT